MSAASAVAKLRRILRRAYKDNFALAMEVDPEALRACVREIARGVSDPEPWRDADRTLEEFASAGRRDRTSMLALLMRLAAALPAPRKAPRSKPELRSPDTPAPLTALRGVGPALANKLAARGLRTVEDLVYLVPRGYDDRRQKLVLSRAEVGDSGVVEGTISTFRSGFLRGGRFMATAVINTPDGDSLTARWFHRLGGIGAKLAPGMAVLVVGTLGEFREQLSMVHPEIYEAGESISPVLVRYPVVEGVSGARLARFCADALDLYEQLDGVDKLPPAVARSAKVMAQVQALRALHQPPSDISPADLEALAAGRSPAHRRLAFDELFFLQLSLLRDRAMWQAGGVTVSVPELLAPLHEEVRACVPFELTGAQVKVLGELEGDLRQPRPMLRLLQGDVGAGKTVLAFGAALAVARSGGQTAIMAPTEILAEQHLHTLGAWCKAADLRVKLLTGSTSSAERRSLLSLLAAGRVDILIGTHALLTGDVNFSSLGLVVVDEQHRFGVEQRAGLRNKGAAPHLLVMTATPIPRSLALTAYGELEVSVLDELPPGRTPTKTVMFTGKSGLAKARAALTKYLGPATAGVRAFVICPLVESSDKVVGSDVEETAAALRETLPDHAIGVLHGRMSTADKDAIMRAFRCGDVQILVATTVVEVGVDVPEASLILIEHAERFGLAQLHQLRGRVGRGDKPGTCLVHTPSTPASDPAKRLAILCETNDGFAVAERDLALRGPGEVFGIRQSGAPVLRFSGFGGEGLRLLVAAREAAAEFLGADPSLADHPHVLDELERRAAGRRHFGAESG